MKNGIRILLYLKVKKHPTWNKTPQYQTEATKSVPETEKYQKYLIKIKKIWKTTKIKE